MKTSNNILKVFKHDPQCKWDTCFLRSLVVTYLRLETKGLQFESCC